MLETSVAAGICMRMAARSAVCDSMSTVLSFTQKRRAKLVEQRNNAKVETETKFSHKSKKISKNNYTAYNRFMGWVAQSV